MKVTLQDLLHAINIIGRDMDVTVDGIDAIAVCPPVKLTPAARKHFKQALNSKVVVEYHDNEHWNTYVSDDDEKIDAKAWTFLESLAGYCNSEDYDDWFEGKDAELI